MNKPLAAILALLGLSVLVVGAQEPQVYLSGNGVSSPTIVKRVKAVYPPQARAAKVEGVVVMTAIVREDGSVSNVSVTRPLDTKFGLDAEAVKAAKQWTFKPGLKAGKPVPVRVTIEMGFSPPSR
jgi:protein TonB